MSKASEYVAHRPVDFDDGYTHASVTKTGAADIQLGAWAASLPPDRAIALARWLLDAFGEDAT